MIFRRIGPLVSALLMSYLVSCEVPLPTAELASPAGLAATPGNEQVVLSWNPVTGATGYNLYWSTSAGNVVDGTKIADVTSPFTHLSLSNGTNYRYALTAVNAKGESPPSSQVAATPQTSTQGLGSVVFRFAPPSQGAPDFYVYPAGFQPGLHQLILSLSKPDGTPYLERTTLDLVSTTTGYQSEPLALPSGAYRVVEAFAVNALRVTKFAVPLLNSPYAKVGPDFDKDWPGSLPLDIDVAADTQTTIALATRPANFKSKPADYGYTNFPSPLPEPESVGVSIQAVDPEGNPVPSFFWKTSITKDSGGGSSTFGWGIRSGVLKNQLSSLAGGGNSGLRDLEFVRFQIGAFGYRDSVHFLKDAQDIYEHRLNDPTYTVVLQPEATLVELKQAGTNASGQPLVTARITSSQFLEEAFDAAGAGAGDKYQFVVGFELGTRAQGDLTPPTTTPSSPLFYMAPYDSQRVQARSDYQTLEATLVLKTPTALAQLLDAGNEPLAQLYLEVAALKGDGKTVFDPDDEILFSAQKVINVGPHQIRWAP